MLFCFTIQSYDFFDKRTNKNQIIFIKSRKNIEKRMKKDKTYYNQGKSVRLKHLVTHVHPSSQTVANMSTSKPTS